MAAPAARGIRRLHVAEQRSEGRRPILLDGYPGGRELAIRMGIAEAMLAGGFAVAVSPLMEDRPVRGANVHGVHTRSPVPPSVGKENRQAGGVETV